jgi:hypothetical protein
MEKFMCTKCQFSLTIKKATDSKPTKITSGAELLVAYNSIDHQEYDIILSEKDFESYINSMKKKDNELISNLRKFYTKLQIQKNIASKYILKCTSCGESYHLEPETVIYSLNFKKQQSSFNDDNIELKLYDPTLPRTKDYICANKNCPSLTKGFDSVKKEAVFYRASGSYHMKYACLVCEESWAI